MIETTAIIISRNRNKMVKNLLKNLFCQEYPKSNLEILVVDDFSDDPYQFPEVKVIRNQKRMGAPASRNIAISRANGKYVLMLDDDVEIRSGEFVKKSIEILSGNKEIGLVVPKKIDMRNEHGRVIPYEFSCSAPTFYSGDLRSVAESRGYIKFGNQVFFTYLEILKKIGGYDSNFGLGIGHSFREESDLHVRIRKLGYKIFHEPSLEIIHKITPEGGHDQNEGKLLYWMCHNHIVFLRKNFADWRIKSVGYLLDLFYYSLCYGRLRHLKDALAGYIKGFQTIKTYEYKS